TESFFRFYFLAFRSSRSPARRQRKEASIEASGVNCAQTVARFAPIHARFAVTATRFTATLANGEPMCAIIVRIGAQTHHGRNCVPTPAQFVATLATFAATVESFAAMFATGVAMSAIIGAIGVMRGKTSDCGFDGAVA